MKCGLGKATPLILIFFLFSSFYLLAAPTPTAAQLEQFKKLPAAQQQALAKQYGIDLGQSTSSQNSDWQQPELLQPRNTNVELTDNSQLSELDRMLAELTDKEELKAFGYDVFASTPTTFSPVSEIPIPLNYILGPGDELNIMMYGKESQQLSLRVQRDGNIILPDFGPFNVAGLSYVEVKKALTSFVQEKALGVEVYISLGELKMMRIFVMGDAFQPGAYNVSSLSTITNALYVSGGIKEIGSLRNIQLKRNGILVGHFDLYDLLINGDASADLLLKAGDVILIPSVGAQVSLDGEVKRPGIYEIKKSETLKDAIAMAGGLKPSASSHDIVIERQTSAIKQLENIDLSNHQELNFDIQAGDNIRVSKASESFDNAIAIIGAVTRPGFYQWKSGIKVSDLLIDIRSDLLTYADYDYALVVRETLDNSYIDVLQFDLSDAIVKKDTNDLELQPNDKILVFSRFEQKNTQVSLSDMAVSESELERQQRLQFLTALKQFRFVRKLLTPEEQLTDNAMSTEVAVEKDDIVYHIAGLMGEMSEDDLNALDEQQVFKHFLVSQYSRQRMLKPVIKRIKELSYKNGIKKRGALASIIGAVKFPGEYPVSQRYSMLDLIAAAGGLTEKAYLNGGELSRTLDDNGLTAIKHLPFVLSEVLDTAAEIELQHQDRINILEMPSWQSTYQVELRGEFKFPGLYSINRDETLGDVIRRAGGLTQYAHADGAVFTRKSLKQKEQENTRKVAAQLQREIATKSLGNNTKASMSYSELKNLVTDLTKLEAVGRMVIDLPSIEKSVVDKDFRLEPGDMLYVPSNPSTINVFGEVQLASSHLFDKYLTLQDYLSLSGGLKSQADPSRIYVIKANGGVKIPSNNTFWFAEDSQIMLEPGDSIIVPIDGDYIDNLSLWSTATQIIYQAAVAIAAISSI
ncbi:SLBB domain-containing protein [Alteromonadaceae bacterium BrNp21-10]|nr:SLBB domain-containing protein [Alteromonadaceae bacterium BrNp21-10]